MIRGTSVLLPAILPLALAGGCPTNSDPNEPSTGTARVSFVNLSPDAPALSLCTGTGALLAGIGYGTVSSYAAVDAGLYRFKAVAAASGCAATGLASTELTLAAGGTKTIVALGNSGQLGLRVLDDSTAFVLPGTARLRFVNALPNSAPIDLTLTDGTPLFDDVDFGEVTAPLAVAAGMYDLDVRDRTGMTLLLPVDGIGLASGGAYTLYAIGVLNGSPAAEMLLVRD